MRIFNKKPSIVIQSIKKTDKCVTYYSDLEQTILHREGGPARIWFDDSKEWFFNNKLHNLTGPATIWRNSLGQDTQSFVIDGVFLHPDKWAEKTGHRVCNFCQNFCQQNCRTNK
jgi:hypothetical protein